MSIKRKPIQCYAGKCNHYLNQTTNIIEGDTGEHVGRQAHEDDVDEVGDDEDEDEDGAHEGEDGKDDEGEGDADADREDDDKDDEDDKTADKDDEE